jgi:hypothetical protein
MNRYFRYNIILFCINIVIIITSESSGLTQGQATMPITSKQYTSDPDPNHMITQAQISAYFNEANNIIAQSGKINGKYGVVCEWSLTPTGKN